MGVSEQKRRFHPAKMAGDLKQKTMKEYLRKYFARNLTQWRLQVLLKIFGLALENRLSSSVGWRYLLTLYVNRLLQKFVYATTIEHESGLGVQ